MKTLVTALAVLGLALPAGIQAQLRPCQKPCPSLRAKQVSHSRAQFYLYAIRFRK